ncbi:MAG: hypothetical protein V2A73_05095 [Pseudomonadota bacterium]
MPIIREFLGRSPQLASEVFVAETAVLIGDVVIGDRSSVGFGVVLRGDEQQPIE